MPPLARRRTGLVVSDGARRSDRVDVRDADAERLRGDEDEDADAR